MSLGLVLPTIDSSYPSASVALESKWQPNRHAGATRGGTVT